MPLLMAAVPFDDRLRPRPPLHPISDVLQRLLSGASTRFQVARNDVEPRAAKVIHEVWSALAWKRGVHDSTRNSAGTITNPVK